MSVAPDDSVPDVAPDDSVPDVAPGSAVPRSSHDDWDPRSPNVLGDQIAAYDEMRGRCPVAHSDYLGWSVFGHADVVAIVTDHDTFSSAVSRYPAVPNGFDPPQHDPYRQLVNRYFTPEHMAAFEPVCRALARDLVSRLPRGHNIEFIAQFALEYALQAQRAWLGWPEYTVDALRHWTARNHRATLHREREELDAVAAEFDATVRRVLTDHRARAAAATAAAADAGTDAAPQATDVTSQLLREQINGVPLTDEEIVSILRNWTVGELGTISASVGILVAYLAEHPELQSDLRSDVAQLAHAELGRAERDTVERDTVERDSAERESAERESAELDRVELDRVERDTSERDTAAFATAKLDGAVDEILRMHSPLIANRRVATRDLELGDRTIRAGERVNVNWASANRDEKVFGNPDEYQPERNAANNVLYGRGIHDCPGAPLARLELRIVMEELLAATSLIAKTVSAAHSAAGHGAAGHSAAAHVAAAHGTASRAAGHHDYAAYPASGFRSLPIILH